VYVSATIGHAISPACSARGDGEPCQAATRDRPGRARPGLGGPRYPILGRPARRRGVGCPWA